MISLFSLVLTPFLSFAGPKCENVLPSITRVDLTLSQKMLEFDLPGVEFANAQDSTNSTGATLIYFPGSKAIAAVDPRGGAVTSVDTTLFGQGTYSQVVDAIVFAGGSSMGLEVHEGVRGAIFEENLQTQGQDADAFENIACVTGACIFDFGARIEPGQDRFVYPRREMGQTLWQSRRQNSFVVGRAGAGVSATTNKITDTPLWGGQGAAFKRYPWGKMMAIVVNNSVGELLPLRNISERSRTQNSNTPEKQPIRPGRNTTLSLIITDVNVDAGFLQRLVTSSHTAMGGMIVPFQTSTDGDIQYAVSTQRRDINYDRFPNLELDMALAARELMIQALTSGAVVANPDVFSSEAAP